MKYLVMDKNDKEVASITCDNLYESKIGDVSTFYVRTGEDGKYCGLFTLSSSEYRVIEL